MEMFPSKVLKFILTKLKNELTFDSILLHKLHSGHLKLFFTKTSQTFPIQGQKFWRKLRKCVEFCLFFNFLLLQTSPGHAECRQYIINHFLQLTLGNKNIQSPKRLSLFVNVCYTITWLRAEKSSETFSCWKTWNYSFLKTCDKLWLMSKPRNATVSIERCCKVIERIPCFSKKTCPEVSAALLLPSFFATPFTPKSIPQDEAFLSPVTSQTGLNVVYQFQTAYPSYIRIIKEKSNLSTLTKLCYSKSELFSLKSEKKQLSD